MNQPGTANAGDAVAAASVRDIFDRAAELPPAQRAAYLDQACAGDAAARREVESLLAALDDAHDVLAGPTAPGALADTAAATLPERAGVRVGRYKLLERIGEGGFGVVFMAEQQQPVRRTVALKVLKPGMDTGQVVARFEAERQALALMDHPNIAKVLDAGATDSGRPYVVMELVRGVPITDYCDQARLSPSDRLKLFVHVCRAVQHAHSKGVIHRDLKPSNVLVTLGDHGEPIPKIIDFGIAKATQSRLTDRTLFTEFRQLLGTPLYMSPEQAEMSALLNVDTRSDVYALGVLLYELLTGTTPFERERLAKAAYDEMRRIIREEEPPRPSTRLSTLAGRDLTDVSARRQTDPARLGQVVRGELDWIVMRCLEKDRGRRYETADGLAKDVERYLADEPVEACPPSRLYRLRKVVRRHKIGVAAVAAVAAALLLGIVGTGAGMARATRAWHKAEKAEALVVMQKTAVEGARDEAERNLAHSKVAEGDALLALDELATARRRFEDALPILQRHGASTFLADLGLWDATRRSPPPLLDFEGHAGRVNCAAFLPDGRHVLSGSEDGTARLWDALTGRTVRVFADVGRVQGLAVSPDGATVALAGIGRGVTLWDVASDNPPREVAGYGGDPLSVAFSPDGRLLMVGSSADHDNGCLFDAASGARRATFDQQPAAPVRAVAFSPDGRYVATATGRAPDDVVSALSPRVNLWDLRSGRRTWSHSEFDRAVTDVSFSPDSATVLASSHLGAVVMLDATTGKESWRVGGTSDVNSVAFSPDGLLAASAGNDGMVKVRWASSGVALAGIGRRTLFFGERAVSFSPDRRFLIAAAGRSVRLWPLFELTAQRSFGLSPATMDSGKDAGIRASCTPDGRLALTSEHVGKRVTLWDVATGRPLSRAAASRIPDEVSGWPADEHTALAAFVEHGRSILLAEPDGGLGVWDLAMGNRRRPLDPWPGRRAAAVAASADGRFALARFWGTDELQLYDVASGERLRTLKLDGARTIDVLAFSPDSSLAAACSREGVVKLWETGTGRERHAWRTRRANAIAFSPDSTLLACGGADLQVFETRSGAAAAAAVAWPQLIWSLAFAPDGRHVLIGGEQGTVALWDRLGGSLRHMDLQQAWQFDLTWDEGHTRLLVAQQGPWGAFQIIDLGHNAQLRQLGTAVRQARKRLEQDPRDAGALLVLGRWYALRRQWDLAAGMLEQAESAGADVPPAELARCRWMCGDGAKAAGDFARAVAAATQEGEAEYLQLCLRRLEEARVHRKDADPLELDRFAAHPYFSLSRVASGSAGHARSVELLNAAAEAVTLDEQTRALVAAHVADSLPARESNLALSLYQEAARRTSPGHPLYGRTCGGLAWLAYRLRRFEEAVTWSRRAIDNGGYGAVARADRYGVPSAVPPNMILGDALWHLGQREEALTAWRGATGWTDAALDGWSKQIWVSVPAWLRLSERIAAAERGITPALAPVASP